MAQRDNKEVTELQVPESVPLCVNNCASSTATATTPTPLTPSSNSVQAKAKSESDPVISLDPSPVIDIASVKVVASSVSTTSSMGPGRPPVNRCFNCRKRVGLTGFRCRCGDLFCGDHRYSDRHGCTYDYKTAGRELISRENPVVRAAKIVRF